jgi:DNA (cytosine-5)-methyltransferase 1
MKYLSLFSGIGGFELGIGKKHKCVGFSEIDKYAIAIYQKQFPKHKNYGDITKIKANELPDFDLLCGGFPCQSFSIAGKRKGFEDTRGTLFFEIARIAKEKRPRYLLLENVKGLLSHDKGRTFKTILYTLDELGYDLQWQILNSKNFGVPQNRERVFIIGHLRGTPRPEIFPLGQNGEPDIILPTLTARYWGGQANGGYLRDVPKQKRIDTKEIVETLKEQGLEPTEKGWESLDKLKKIGTIGKDSEATRVYDPKGIAWTLKNGGGMGAKTGLYMVKEATKKGYAEAKEGDSINISVPNSKTRRGRFGHGVAQTLDTGVQQCVVSKSMIRRLTPKECERLQGFPDGWTEGISDSQRYKCLGNAVTVNVIKAICEKLK